MADFTVRSDSVNVEQIMEQIRARIREKRGVDYTEQQIRELAAVKLEKFLDPRGVRSDLLEQFRQRVQPAYEPPELPNFAFEEETLFESHRAPIRWIRRLLRPFLKLFFNPNPLIQALHIQSRLNTLNALNAERDARREEAARRGMEQLSFEVMHNLVIETTRLGIDVKNLKMRVESLASRLEFNERRARALESVVAYRPSSETDAERPRGAVQPAEGRTVARPPAISGPVPPPGSGHTGPGYPPAAPGRPTGEPEGPGQRSRRRRRRRGRRGGASAVSTMGLSTATPETPSANAGSSLMTTPEQSASASSHQNEGDSATEGALGGDRSSGTSTASNPSREDSIGEAGPPPPDHDEQ